MIQCQHSLRFYRSRLGEVHARLAPWTGVGEGKGEAGVYDIHTTRLCLASQAERDSEKPVLTLG